MLNNEQELATLRKKVKKLKQENQALKETLKKFVVLAESVVRGKRCQQLIEGSQRVSNCIE